MAEKTIEKILCRVEKPARYMGGELNSRVKNEALVRMGLCYPDLYEVGMANNGIQILYDAANGMEHVACERVFAVAPDLEKALCEENLPLYTLETYTPLKDLDLLAFNVAHELLYTGMLQVMDLGGIPLRSADRSDQHPVIMAGGESISNPAPLMPFVDAFFMGDGEEGMVDICRVLRNAKEEGLSRDSLLEGLAGIEGVLVPGKSSRVRKRVFRSNTGPGPLKPVVPSIRITQERVVVEVNRGCRNLCKFCHAGYYDLPYRKFSWEGVRDRVFAMLDSTGYDEVSFASLCLNDYRHLVELLNGVLPGLTERGVSVALPSLRVEPDTVPVIEQVSDVRRASLTFAVESATDELRKIAFKRLHTADIISIIQKLYDRGWQRVKLYFMIGLPGYRDHDEAADIIALLNEIYSIGKNRLQLNVTVSPFVPKPHTPFQHEEQAGTRYLLDTIQRIKRGVPRKIQVKNHDVYHSLLEGVLSRGDGHLADVIEDAYRAGSRLDSWSEYFSFATWEQALETRMHGWQGYLNKRMQDGNPWEVVETGFEKLTAAKSRATWDGNSLPRSFNTGKDVLNREEVQLALRRFEEKYQVEGCVRLALSKTGMSRFIPHIDFMEVLKRALRMAHLPVSFTQGFNKRERISMGYALPLGTESEAEFCDVELYRAVDPRSLPDLLNPLLPHGIMVTAAGLVDDGSSLTADVSYMEYLVITEDADTAGKLVSGMEEKPSFEKKTKKGLKTVAFDDAILHWEPEEGGVLLHLPAGLPQSIRADSIVLQVTGHDDLSAFRIIKRAQFLTSERGPLHVS